MTEQECEAIVREFIAAWNARDRQAIGDAFHSDILCIGASYPAAQGKEAALALCEPFLTADEIDWKITNCATRGNIVFTQRIDRFRFGDKPWLVVEACGVFELDGNGRIRRWQDYFDSKGLEEVMA